MLVLAGAGGLIWAWSRRAWGLLLYVLTATVGCLIVTLLGSPWVDGKALATASPAFVLAGLVGAAALSQRGRRIEALVLAAAIAGGVLWSNALAFSEVNLAPRDRLAELGADRRANRGAWPDPHDRLRALRGEALPARRRSERGIRAPPSSRAASQRSAAAETRLGRRRSVPNGCAARLPHFGAPARSRCEPSPSPSNSPHAVAITRSGRGRGDRFGSPTGFRSVIASSRRHDRTATSSCGSRARRGRRTACGSTPGTRDRPPVAARHLPPELGGQRRRSRSALPAWCRDGTRERASPLEPWALRHLDRRSFSRLTRSDGRPGAVASLRHELSHAGQFVRSGASTSSRDPHGCAPLHPSPWRGSVPAARLSRSGRQARKGHDPRARDPPRGGSCERVVRPATRLGRGRRVERAADGRSLHEIFHSKPQLLSVP